MCKKKENGSANAGSANTGTVKAEPGVSTLEDKASRKVALVASRIWQVLEATR